jgi:hypothetical protein
VPLQEGFVTEQVATAADAGDPVPGDVGDQAEADDDLRGDAEALPAVI